MDASKNQFYNGIDFSKGIESEESMPGVLKSLKIQCSERSLLPVAGF
jgi:hypothetical protein